MKVASEDSSDEFSDAPPPKKTCVESTVVQTSDNQNNPQHTALMTQVLHGTLLTTTNQRSPIKYTNFGRNPIISCIKITVNSNTVNSK